MKRNEMAVDKIDWIEFVDEPKKICGQMERHLNPDTNLKLKLNKSKRIKDKNEYLCCSEALKNRGTVRRSNEIDETTKTKKKTNKVNVTKFFVPIDTKISKQSNITKS